MKFTIIIPSYWGREAGEPFNEEDAVYDHPTSIDSPGTLGRALESIGLLGYDDFRVVIIGAATHPSLNQAMEDRLEKIVNPFRHYLPVIYLGPSRFAQIMEIMGARGGEDNTDMLSLRGYSNIRNCCLAAACLTGADAAVLFDDDEAYEDREYLLKVAENIGGEFKDRFIGALAGYYVNADGNYYLPPNRDWVYSEWPAIKAMNQAFEIIESAKRLKVTPWVFGGNMVIHRDLYMKVAFDPSVPRGEDIDYLINARFLGYYFFLDNRLWIRHLPPPKTAPQWRRLREDIDRFVYTRAKLKSQDPDIEGWRLVGLEELDPYPGRFLRPDLDDMIFRTCVLMGLDYLSKGDRTGFEESMANIHRATMDEGLGLNPYARYVNYRARWERCMHFLDSSRELKDYVMALYD